jgi:hypothetical protein
MTWTYADGCNLAGLGGTGPWDGLVPACVAAAAATPEVFIELMMGITSLGLTSMAAAAATSARGGFLGWSYDLRSFGLTSMAAATATPESLVELTKGFKSVGWMVPVTRVIKRLDRARWFRRDLDMRSRVVPIVVAVVTSLVRAVWPTIVDRLITAVVLPRRRRAGTFMVSYVSSFGVDTVGRVRGSMSMSLAMRFKMLTTLTRFKMYGFLVAIISMFVLVPVVVVAVVAITILVQTALPRHFVVWRCHDRWSFLSKKLFLVLIL